MPHRPAISRPARAAIAFTALLASGAIAACGSDDDAAAEVDGPTIAATTGVMADLANHLAGPDANVVQVIPDAVSPHDFALSARDRATIGDADLLIAVGGGLEAGVPIEDIGVERWELLDHVADPIALGDDDHRHDEDGDEHAHVEDEEHADEDNDRRGDEGRAEEADDDHDHGPTDPHAWLDPVRLSEALPTLAAAIAEVDPANREAYRARARDYAAQLEALDAEIESTLSAVPRDGRNIVTSHDALGYFADRYGFDVVATPFGTAGPEAQVSADRLRRVIEAVEEHDVPALFAQQTDSPRLLERVGAATGAEVVTGLLVEAPASADSYTEMMRTNATLIADALGR